MGFPDGGSGVPAHPTSSLHFGFGFAGSAGCPGEGTGGRRELSSVKWAEWAMWWDTGLEFAMTFNLNCAGRFKCADSVVHHPACSW